MNPSDQEAIRHLLEQYQTGTYHADTEALKGCFHADAVMNGFLMGQLIAGGPEPFFEDMQRNPAMSETGAPYRGEVAAIHITGNVASATLRETGFAGTMTLTNYFHLIKTENTWKIISKTFTTE